STWLPDTGCRRGYRQLPEGGSRSGRDRPETESSGHCCGTPTGLGSDFASLLHHSRGHRPHGRRTPRMSPAIILAGWALALLASWSLGRILLHALALRLSRLETELFAFLGGSACLSTAVFLLCSAGLARKGVFIGLCAITTVAAVRILRADPLHDKTPLASGQLTLLLVAVVPYTVLY